MTSVSFHSCKVTCGLRVPGKDLREHPERLCFLKTTRSSAKRLKLSSVWLAVQFFWRCLWLCGSWDGRKRLEGDRRAFFPSSFLSLQTNEKLKGSQKMPKKILFCFILFWYFPQCDYLWFSLQRITVVIFVITWAGLWWGLHSLQFCFQSTTLIRLQILHWQVHVNYSCCDYFYLLKMMQHKGSHELNIQSSYKPQTEQNIAF